MDVRIYTRWSATNLNDHFQIEHFDYISKWFKVIVNINFKNSFYLYFILDFLSKFLVSLDFLFYYFLIKFCFFFLFSHLMLVVNFPFPFCASFLDIVLTLSPITLVYKIQTFVHQTKPHISYVFTMNCYEFREYLTSGRKKSTSVQQ